MEEDMRTKNSLLALLVPATLAVAAAAHADPRLQANVRFGTPFPRYVHAPAPEAYRAPVPRFGRNEYPHGDRYGAQGYWAWDGYRQVWVGAPLTPPSPYHVPVFDREGWFVGWEDMSGDVPRRDVELLRQNYRSQRD